MSSRRRSTRKRSAAASISDDEDDSNQKLAFKRGSVVRIKLKNFMTYSSVELKAGPYLNLIIGPNGTGKSAIICGLIVGLAGEVSLTGRAGSMADYVKFGCEVALTEIELFNPDGKNFLIQRKIIKGNAAANGQYKCTSEWILNGKSAQQKDVKAFTQNYNIAVDNLCQFLPQEKVAEFVKMGPKELLENTEKATGDMSLFEDHQKLIKISKDIFDTEKNKRTLEEKTKTDENINRRAEQALERLKERKKVEERIKILILKKPWVEFEEKRVRYVDERKEMDKLIKKKKKAEDSIQPYKKMADKLKEKGTAFEKDLIVKKQNIKNTLVKNSNIVKGIREELQQSNKAADEFKLKLLEFQRRQEDIRRIKQEIQNTELGLQQKREESVLGKLIEGVDDKLKEVLKEISEKESKRYSLVDKRTEMSGMIEECNDKIKRMDTYNRRKEQLRQQNQNAFRALEVLDGMKDRLRKTIHPPMMLTIDCLEAGFAKYVENCIPRRDLFAFVCEDPEDMKLFSRELESRRLRAALVMAPRNGHEYRPDFSPRELKPLGFNRFVADMFTAPDAIMSYVKNQYNVHNIPVGGPAVSSNLKSCQDKGLRSFFSADKRYNISKSRYDNQFITSQDGIQEASVLTIMKEADKVQRELEKKRKLEEQIVVCNEEFKKIDVEITRLKSNEKTSLQSEVRLLQGELDEVRTSKKKLQLKRNELLKKENFTFDKEAEEEALKASIKSSAEKILELMKKAASVFEAVVSQTEKKFSVSTVVHSNREKRIKAENAWKEAKASISSLEQEIRDKEVDVGQLKVTAQRLRDAAVRDLEASGYVMNEGANGKKTIPNEILEVFNELPDSLIEIQAEISGMKAKIQGMDIGMNEGAEEEYNERQAAIEKNRKCIQEMEFNLDQHNKNLERTKTRWMTPLKNAIEKISTSFSASMTSLGYAGEVVLKETERNFEDYGILVRVKYRDEEQVQDLSAYTQSGGERSVATIIYMMALQGLTKVPFRAVDEINQGMDSTNERKIFHLIVNNAVSNSSQYFLLTPKLLMGLDYPDKMEIHTICNGEVEGSFIDFA